MLVAISPAFERGFLSKTPVVAQYCRSQATGRLEEA